MKFPATSIKSLIFKNKTYTYIFSLAIPIVFGLVFLLVSFKAPELPKPIKSSPPTSFKNKNISSKLTYKVSDIELVGTKIQEASILKMEQTKGLFTKNLNMSVVDDSGNLVALVLTDVKNGGIGTNLNTGIFYGKEHLNVSQNFSIDLGTVVFSNNSNLILERENGSSTHSRNGWIEISKCENGLLSGKFEFEIEGENSKIISNGKFENVAYIVNE